MSRVLGEVIVAESESELQGEMLKRLKRTISVLRTQKNTRRWYVRCSHGVSWVAELRIGEQIFYVGARRYFSTKEEALAFVLKKNKEEKKAEGGLS